MLLKLEFAELTRIPFIAAVEHQVQAPFPSWKSVLPLRFIAFERISSSKTWYTASQRTPAVFPKVGRRSLRSRHADSRAFRIRRTQYHYTAPAPYFSVDNDKNGRSARSDCLNGSDKAFGSRKYYLSAPLLQTCLHTCPGTSSLFSRRRSLPASLPSG